MHYTRAHGHIQIGDGEGSNVANFARDLGQVLSTDLELFNRIFKTAIKGHATSVTIFGLSVLECEGEYCICVDGCTSMCVFRLCFLFVG